VAKQGAIGWWCDSQTAGFIFGTARAVNRVGLANCGPSANTMDQDFVGTATNLTT
jgi:hypothetical protein